MSTYPSSTVAWLQGAGGLILQARPGTADFPWNSAITRLITGINAEFGEERYRLLRQKIHATGSISEWDRNLVKVCAKRVANDPYPMPAGNRVIDIGRDLEPDPLSDRTERWRSSLQNSNQILEWLNMLVADEMKVSQESRRHQSHRPVAAALVDEEGRLLAANVNTNAGMQMRHAEVNLLLALTVRGISRIPEGATLYVSLKPCRMCASLINALNGSGQAVRVVALQDDPGTHGRHALLPGLQILSK
ncbi:MAG: hypothetical protein RIQ81_712 [Pseudomonadota bacterium]